jgi:hypothetical protein
MRNRVVRVVILRKRDYHPTTLVGIGTNVERNTS